MVSSVKPISIKFSFIHLTPASAAEGRPGGACYTLLASNTYYNFCFRIIFLV